METQLQVFMFSCCITSASSAYLRACKYMYINNMMASYIGFSLGLFQCLVLALTCEM